MEFIHYLISSSLSGNPKFAFCFRLYNYNILQTLFHEGYFYPHNFPALPHNFNFLSPRRVICLSFFSPFSSSSDRISFQEYILSEDFYSSLSFHVPLSALPSLLLNPFYPPFLFTLFSFLVSIPSPLSFIFSLPFSTSIDFYCSSFSFIPYNPLSSLRWFYVMVFSLAPLLNIFSCNLALPLASLFP